MNWSDDAPATAQAVAELPARTRPVYAYPTRRQAEDAAPGRGMPCPLCGRNKAHARVVLDVTHAGHWIALYVCQVCRSTPVADRGEASLRIVGAYVALTRGALP
jgi:hypothetical protein